MIISKHSKLPYHPHATDEQINQTWIGIRDMARNRKDITNFHITTNRSEYYFELKYEQQVNWFVGQFLVMWSKFRNG